MIFVDTCILIDYSKDNIEIEEQLFQDYSINSIVQLELLAGAFNKRELKKLNIILDKCQLLEIDQDIMDLSVKLMNRYGLSHNHSLNLPNLRPSSLDTQQKRFQIFRDRVGLKTRRSGSSYLDKNRHNIKINRSYI